MSAVATDPSASGRVRAQWPCISEHKFRSHLNLLEAGTAKAHGTLCLRDEASTERRRKDTGRQAQGRRGSPATGQPATSPDPPPSAKVSGPVRPPVTQRYAHLSAKALQDAANAASGGDLEEARAQSSNRRRRRSRPDSRWREVPESQPEAS